MAIDLNASFASLQKRAADAWAPLGVRLKAELATSDRLKILLSVAALALVLAGLFGLGSVVGNLERRHAVAEANLIRLKMQIESNVWKGREDQSRAMKSVLEERLWTAHTAGLAQAEFDRWLRERLSHYKLTPQQQIQVQRAPISGHTQPGQSDLLANIQRMTAKVVITPVDPKALMNVLADIAESQKIVVIEHLIVRAGRNPRVEMDASTFYRVSERKP